MKLTRANIKKVIEDNFSEYVDMDFIGIKKSGEQFIVLSKPQGINAEVFESPKWEHNFIQHLKWQLYI